MNLIKTMLLVFCSLLVTEGLAYAYIGPGLGLGSIGLIIGFFLSIFLAVMSLPIYAIEVSRVHEQTRFDEAIKIYTDKTQTLGIEEIASLSDDEFVDGWDSTPKEGHTQRLNMVLLYDVSKPGEPVLIDELPAKFLHVTNLSFSSDSRWLASGAAGVGATVWDLHAPDIAASRKSSEVGSHRLSAVSFSPSGKWLALGGMNEDAAFKGMEIFHLLLGRKKINAINCFSENFITTTEYFIATTENLTEIRGSTLNDLGTSTTSETRYSFSWHAAPNR